MRALNNYLIIYDESSKTCRAYPVKNKRAIIKYILDTVFNEHEVRITSTYIDNDSVT